jgi:hypothetical protein
MDGVRHDYEEAVKFDQIAALLATAIQGFASTRADINNNAVKEYNDAKGRTLEDILCVIGKARALAQTEAPLLTVPF